ncbi:MAG: hypothetical protein OEY01_11630 [Desulfobulbaceae bacterium]|nr:hypothetical protein [Desulfobulbaceae bacterium]
MNKKLIISGILIAAALGGWLIHYFSDRQVIRRQLHTIAQNLSKEGEEAPVMMALRMKQVLDRLDRQCLIEIPEQGFSEAMEPGLIIRYLINYRGRQATLLVAVDEITVEIPAPGRGAVATLIRLTGNAGRPDFFEERHRVEFSLQKIEKKWLIQKALLPEELVRY